MKLSSDLPRWLAVPLRIVFYLFVMFILYNIAAVFVVGNLARNIVECSAGRQGRYADALGEARQMVVCLDEKNGLLEELAFRPLRNAIEAMPNNPKQFVGRWNSAQPRCQYEFELRETGEFIAEPLGCSLSNRTFTGQWGVHDGQMVWLYAAPGPWRPDINALDVVDADFFLLTEHDGSRTRFTRVGKVRESSANVATPAVAEPAPTAEPAQAALAMPVEEPMEGDFADVADSKGVTETAEALVEEEQDVPAKPVQSDTLEVKLGAPAASTTVQTDASGVSVAKEYAAVMSVCKTVGSTVDPQQLHFNAVGAGSAAQAYFHERGSDLVYREKAPATVLQGPLHGKLVPDAEYPGTYIYYPDAGYAGPDQMVLATEVRGIKLKIIYTVDVTKGDPSLSYPGDPCPGGFQIDEPRR